MTTSATVETDTTTLAPNPDQKWSWKMPEKWLRGQFSHLDRFVVCSKSSNFAIEGHGNGLSARSACQVLNENSIEHTGVAGYDVRPIPKKLHNHNPQHWQALLKEDESIRKARIETITGPIKVNYPPEFVVLARARLQASPSGIDWAALHEEFLRQNIGFDVLAHDRALSSILHLSPGAVTHAEQDAVCDLLKKLLSEHAQAQTAAAAPARRPSIGR